MKNLLTIWFCVVCVAVFIVFCVTQGSNTANRENSITYSADGKMMSLYFVRGGGANGEKASFIFKRCEIEGAVTYHISGSIDGNQPLFLQTNGAVIVIAEREFPCVFLLDPETKTNSFGESSDSVFMEWKEDAFAALAVATCSNLVLRFPGGGGTCDVTFAESSLARLTNFAAVACRKDKLIFRSASTP